jgi:DNA polymerase-3 subunit beta
MKLRIERDALADAVAWAARTLPTKSPHPVLSGVLLVAGEDRVRLSSSDQAVSSEVTFEADVAEPGEVVVIGRLLADIAKALPPQPVSLVLEGSRVVLTCGRASFTLPTLPVMEYPALPELPPILGRVPGGAFADAVGQVAFAASRDDSIPVLTGIRMELAGQRIAMVATDRYRLALRELPWQPASTDVEANVLVRAKTLADLTRPLAHVPTVDLALDDSHSRLGLTGGARQSTTPLLDGDFPDYRRLLPGESTSVATVTTAELIESVKRVKLVVDRPNVPILFEFSDGEVLLRAGAGEDAQASETIEGVLDGDPIKIAFNPEYLLEGLSALGSATARVAMTLPNRPAVLSGGDDEELAYRYLLMPVRLAG